MYLYRAYEFKKITPLLSAQTSLKLGPSIEQTPSPKVS